MSDSNFKGPIFILGVARSGTTLLSLMLDSHPHIAVGRETGIMQAAHHLFGDNSLQDDPEWKFDFEWYKTYGVDRAGFSVYVRNFLNSFFMDYAVKQGKKRWAEKTPRHTSYADLILDVFPDAQFLHIVRDPRAVCSSRKSWGHSVEECAREWQVENDKVEAFASKISTNQIYRIRYEDLVVHKDQKAREIIAFLNEPWDDSVLRHHEIAKDKYLVANPEKGVNYKEGRVFEGKPLLEGGVQNNPGREIDTASMFSWMKKLRKTEIRLIQEIAKEGMARYGYENATGLIPFISTVRLKTKEELGL